VQVDPLDPDQVAQVGQVGDGRHVVRVDGLAGVADLVGLQQRGDGGHRRHHQSAQHRGRDFDADPQITPKVLHRCPHKSAVARNSP
jgi:hypothetical protein